MESDPFVPDDAWVRRWLVNQMALMAIHGDKEVEARSLFGFQQAGALEGIGRPAVPLTKIARVVEDPKHRLRVPATLGPCVLVGPERGSDGHKVFLVAALLIENTPRHRKGALAHLDRLASANLLTERTRRTIAERRTDLLSSDGGRWRGAATMIYDAAEQDWLLNLAGLRQALEWEFEEGIRDYLPRVLRPSATAVDSIDLVWWHPRDQRGEIGQAIAGIARNAGTFTEALEGYYLAFGHVPLAPDLSMGRLVAEWRCHHPGGNSPWPELLSWADTNGSPVARYHMCQAAVSDPALIPADRLGEFWAEVSVMLAPELKEEGQWHGAWHLRWYLARHYCQYFEVLLPWNDGQRVAAMAWWLTERTASLFDRTGVNLEPLQELFFTRTYLQWHLARARADVSEIRLQTLFNPSVWQRSLLTQLGDVTASGLDATGASTDVRDVIDAGFVLHSWQGFRPEEREEPSQTAYALEGPLIGSFQRWLAASADGERKLQLQGFLDVLQDLKTKPLAEQLSETDGPAEGLNLWGTRAAAYSGTLPLESLEALMRDTAAASRILTGLDDTNLWLLADVLMETAAASETDWRVAVPHTFATACLACGDEERRNLLFGLAVHSSVATDSVSAIRVLLQHPDRGLLLEPASLHHRHLTAQLPAAPQWLASRIRATLAALDLLAL